MPEGLHSPEQAFLEAQKVTDRLKQTYIGRDNFTSEEFDQALEEESSRVDLSPLKQKGLEKVILYLDRNKIEQAVEKYYDAELPSEVVYNIDLKIALIKAIMKLFIAEDEENLEFISDEFEIPEYYKKIAVENLIQQAYSTGKTTLSPKLEHLASIYAISRKRESALKVAGPKELIEVGQVEKGVKMAMEIGLSPEQLKIENLDKIVGLLIARKIYDKDLTNAIKIKEYFNIFEAEINSVCQDALEDYFDFCLEIDYLSGNDSSGMNDIHYYSERLPLLIQARDNFDVERIIKSSGIRSSALKIYIQATKDFRNKDINFLLEFFKFQTSELRVTDKTLVRELFEDLEINQAFEKMEETNFTREEMVEAILDGLDVIFNGSSTSSSISKHNPLPAMNRLQEQIKERGFTEIGVLSEKIKINSLMSLKRKIEFGVAEFNHESEIDEDFIKSDVFINCDFLMSLIRFFELTPDDIKKVGIEKLLEKDLSIICKKVLNNIQYNSAYEKTSGFFEFLNYFLSLKNFLPEKLSDEFNESLTKILFILIRDGEEEVAKTLFEFVDRESTVFKNLLQERIDVHMETNNFRALKFLVHNLMESYEPYFATIAKSVPEMFIEDDKDLDNLAVDLKELDPDSDGAIVQDEQVMRQIIGSALQSAEATYDELIDFYKQFGVKADFLNKKIKVMSEPALEKLKQIVPEFAEKITDSPALTIWLCGTEDSTDQIIKILQEKPYFADQVLLNPRYGIKLLVRYLTLDNIARGKLDLIIKLNSEHERGDLTDDQYRIKIQNELKDKYRNAEMLKEFKSYGIDVDQWLNFDRRDQFLLGEDSEEVSISEALITPISRYGQELTNLLMIYKKSLQDKKEYFSTLKIQVQEQNSGLDEQIEKLGKEIEKAKTSDDKGKVAKLESVLEKLKSKQKVREVDFWNKAMSDMDGIQTINKALLDKNNQNLHIEELFKGPSSVDPLIRSEYAKNKEEIHSLFQKLDTKVVDFRLFINAAMRSMEPLLADVLKNETDRAEIHHEHMGDDFDTIINLFRSDKIGKVSKRFAQMEVGLWSRDTKTDIYLGNYTNCCVSIEGSVHGEKSPIADYITDLGMQVAVIKDKDEDIPAVAAWLFIGEDENNNQSLVVDNIEANTDYSAYYQDQLTDKLFNWLIDYAQKIGIKKIVLGQENNDLPSQTRLNQLKSDDEQYFKTGGFNERGDENSREGYYLEAEQVKIIWEAA